MPDHVGVLGGTGNLGRGLAARWAAAGLSVTIGSRDAERAEAVARDINSMVAPALAVRGVENSRIGDAPIVVIAVPYDALARTLRPLSQALDGAIIVSAVNPLRFGADGPAPLSVEDGSAAQAVAKLLPGSRVTAALHTVSSQALVAPGAILDDDVPVVGGDPDAVAQVVSLVDRIEGARAFAAGPLHLSGPLESLVAVLISTNRIHRSHVGLRFSRLDV